MSARFGYLLFIPLMFAFLTTRSQILARVAGNGIGIPGYSGNGQLARNAELYYPSGLARDKDGDLYIADYQNSVIRKIDKNGIISVIAGTGEQGFSGDGGPATAAKLTYPTYLFFTQQGDLLFSSFQQVRKIDRNGIITTIAGQYDPGFSGDNGPATAAKFKNPCGIATDASGNIYIADSYNDRIRKIDGAGIITTYAGSYSGYSGNGDVAKNARFCKPSDITFDKYGNMFIADRDNHVIRKINTAGIVSTVAGNGFSPCSNSNGWGGDGLQATNAALSTPVSIRVDDSGALYICEILNNVVRKVNSNGIVSTIAGMAANGIGKDGAPARYSMLTRPFGLWVSGSGDVYFSDRDNHMVYRILNDTQPSFSIGNAAYIDICFDSIRYALGSVLSVNDPDEYQGLTWSVIDHPQHGIVPDGYEGVAGSARAPETMYYIPYRNYTGSDSFTVRVSDGYSADTTVVKVNIPKKSTIDCRPTFTTGDVYLSGLLSCNSESLAVTVCNTIGQRVFYKDLSAPAGIVNEHLQLDRSLARGIYVLTISGAGQHSVFRLQLN